MSNYRVQNIGLGDLIFFSTFVLNNHEKNTTIGVNLSKKVLEKLRNNSNNYKNFCFDLLKIILKDFVVKEIEDNPEYPIWNSSTISPNYFHNEKTLSELKNNLLTTESEKFDTNNYIVLFTKVRDLHKREYQKIYNPLYEYLNNCNKQIILLGEQKVLYNEEYKVHGENMIYSLYDDYIKNINPSKIIDLTKETFDFEKFSITNFLSDFKLINNSFFTIVFGGGGFFCSSLFTGKLLSLTNRKYESTYKSKSFPNIFSNGNDFLRFLNKKTEKVTMKKSNYSCGDHRLTSLNPKILSDHINPVFFETGTNTGLGVQCAIDSGFQKVVSIDIEERYYEMAQINFLNNPFYSHIDFNFYLGDSGVVMSEILNKIDKKITFWLDGHEFYKIPLINELNSIKNHKVKGHTIIIDDVRMLNRPEWNNIGLETIINKIKEIDKNYEIEFVDSVNGENDILIAKINTQ